MYFYEKKIAITLQCTKINLRYSEQRIFFLILIKTRSYYENDMATFIMKTESYYSKLPSKIRITYSYFSNLSINFLKSVISEKSKRNEISNKYLKRID